MLFTATLEAAPSNCVKQLYNETGGTANCRASSSAALQQERGRERRAEAPPVPRDETLTAFTAFMETHSRLKRVYLVIYNLTVMLSSFTFATCALKRMRDTAFHRWATLTVHFSFCVIIQWVSVISHMKERQLRESELGSPNGSLT